MYPARPPTRGLGLEIMGGTETASAANAATPTLSTLRHDIRWSRRHVRRAHSLSVSLSVSVSNGRDGA